MRIEQFIQELGNLFIESEEDSQGYIIDRLDNQRSRLNRLISELDNDVLHLTIGRDSVKRNVNNLYANIKDSVNAFLNGFFNESRCIIYKQFFDRNNPSVQPLPAREFSPDTIGHLYRLRGSNTYNLYSISEMFHIPFEKRGLVSNQRYSVSGYPCLYLGTSIYDCWEEVNRPNIDTSNIVSVKPTSNVKVIDLSIPDFNDLHIFSKDDIYRLVLPLACSLKTNNDYTFKPEYIIPQNVLSCIIYRNGQEGEPITYNGIKYTSSSYRRDYCLFEDKCLMTNYVFPIKESRAVGLCSELVEKFILTQPTSFIERRLTQNERRIFMIAGEEDIPDTYRNSMWGIMEEYLNNQEHRVID